MSKRRRVLLTPLCDGRTSVHRAIVLGQALGELGYEIHIGAASTHHHFFQPFVWTIHELPELDRVMIREKSLHWDSSWHTEQSLAAFVNEDCTLLEQLRPDAIVNLHRTSMYLAARHFNIPIFSLNNADFTPYYPHTLSHDLIEDLLSHRSAALLRKWQSTQNTALIQQTVSAFIRKEAIALLRPYQSHLDRFGLKLDNYFQLFEGDLTFILDLESILNLPHKPDSYIYTGPLFYEASLPIPTIRDPRSKILICHNSKQSPQTYDPLIEKFSGAAYRVDTSNGSADEFNLAGLAAYDLIIHSGSRDVFYWTLRCAVPGLVVPAITDHKLFAQTLRQQGLALHVADVMALTGAQILQRANALRSPINNLQQQIKKNVAQHIAQQIDQFLEIRLPFQAAC